MKTVILVLLSFVLVGAHVIDNKKNNIASDDNGEWWRSGVVRLKYFLKSNLRAKFQNCSNFLVLSNLSQKFHG
jgi:hypothetical protein